MFALKIISMIYIILQMLCFIWFDCKSKNADESIGYKIFCLLSGANLAYIVMNQWLKGSIVEWLIHPTVCRKIEGSNPSGTV